MRKRAHYRNMRTLFVVVMLPWVLPCPVTRLAAFVFLTAAAARGRG